MELSEIVREIEKQWQLDSRFLAMGINPNQFKAPKPDIPGFIYAIQSSDGQIKIGWAKYVEDRLKQLQTGSPQRLRLLGYWRGTRKDEGHIHSMVKSLQIRGEWYKPDKHLIDYIKEMNERNERIS